jgi:hypothetical protein
MPSRLPAATSRTERFEEVAAPEWLALSARIRAVACVPSLRSNFLAAPRHARKRAYQPSSALM